MQGSALRHDAENRRDDFYVSAGGACSAVRIPRRSLGTSYCAGFCFASSNFAKGGRRRWAPEAC